MNIVHFFGSSNTSSHGRGPRFCSQVSISISFIFSYSDSSEISSVGLKPIAFSSSSGTFFTCRYLYLKQQRKSSIEKIEDNFDFLWIGNNLNYLAKQTNKRIKPKKENWKRSWRRCQVEEEIDWIQKVLEMDLAPDWVESGKQHLVGSVWKTVNAHVMPKNSECNKTIVTRTLYRKSRATTHSVTRSYWEFFQIVDKNKHNSVTECIFFSNNHTVGVMFPPC